MPYLILTHGEAEYLALRVKTGPTGFTGQIGRDWRVRFMEAAMRGCSDTVMLDVDTNTLWALDEFLTGMDGQEGRLDVRGESCPDGVPLIKLLDKIQQLLVEESYADQNGHTNQDADAHAPAYRSEDGERA